MEGVGHRIIINLVQVQFRVQRPESSVGRVPNIVTAHSGAVFTNLSQDHLDYHPSLEAYFEAKADVKSLGNQPIPLNVRNAPTKLLKSLDYGKCYEMYPRKPGSKEESYLPEKLKGKKYLKRPKKAGD